MRTHWLRLVGTALVWSAQVAAQQPASVQTERPAGPDPGVVQRMAPVVLDGVTLFQVRGTFAFPAEQRAAEIADRIRAFAADRSVPIESLTVRETPEATFVVAGDYRLFAVLDADGELEGLRRQVLADVSRTRVANAVRAFRHDREPAQIWSDIIRAVIATIIFAAVLWLTRRALRRVRMAMERRVRCEPCELHAIRHPPAPDRLGSRQRPTHGPHLEPAG